MDDVPVSSWNGCLYITERSKFRAKLCCQTPYNFGTVVQINTRGIGFDVIVLTVVRFQMESNIIDTICEWHVRVNGCHY